MGRARKTSIRGPFGGMIDISLIGDKALERKLKRLPLAIQKKAVRPALVKVAREYKRDVDAAIPVDTGKLKQLGMSIVSPRRSRRGAIGRFVLTPTREALGIPGDAKYYYPAHLELGHGNVKPRPYIRGTMHNNRERYHVQLRREIGKRLIRVATKK